MPKRKRDDGEEDVVDRIDDRAIRVKASRLRAKIDQGNKSLKSALILARGFERQKLGRRQKEATHEPHTLLRLREEVIILKQLDISQTARQYLLKQLVRTKRIKETNAFVALYGQDPKIEPAKSTAETNILGRLFNANPVKQVLPDILKGIKDVLGLDKSDVSGVKKPKSNGNMTKTTSKDEGQDFARFSDEEVNDKRSSAESSQEEAHGSENGVLQDEDKDESEDDYAEFNGRIAASSDESDNEDISKNDSDSNIDVKSQDSQTSESVSLSGSEDLDTEKEPRPKARKTAAISQPLTSTAFLPSLSMGGYYSGSESGEDDDLDQYSGPPIKLERKNRRGQRARQKIAEKKYGKEAKHVAKQQLKENVSRNNGWDARKGAVEGGEKRFGKPFGRGRFGNQGSGPTGANGDAVNSSRLRAQRNDVKKEDGPLHPSWQAAKKRKEEGGKAEFAGKKITFD